LLMRSIKNLKTKRPRGTPTGVGVTNFLGALPSRVALFVVGGISVWWFEFLHKPRELGVVDLTCSQTAAS